MEGGSVLFVAVNKDVCPSQISSGLMSNSRGPGLSKANTPTALRLRPPPHRHQMNRAFLASGPPSFVLCLALREGRKEEGYPLPTFISLFLPKGRRSPDREELTLGIELINSRCVQVLIN